MEHIIYKKEGAVARIQFNRPDKLNAFNEPMMSEFKQSLDTASLDDEVRVIIVSGAGRAFSAGVDLKSTTPEQFQAGGSFMEAGQDLITFLKTIPKVTIAQVHGYCFTGALELMMFFDLCFCTEETQFGDTHAKWAVMPRWGMSQNLARRVGLIKAKELSFRAMRVKGVEAERIGLVNRAFKEEELADEVNRIVEDIVGNSFEAIAAIKKLYNTGYDTTLKEGMSIEYNTDSRLSSTQDQLDQFEKKKFQN